jgi:hypothetical protein
MIQPRELRSFSGVVARGAGAERCGGERLAGPGDRFGIFMRNIC